MGSVSNGTVRHPLPFMHACFIFDEVASTTTTAVYRRNCRYAARDADRHAERSTVRVGTEETGGEKGRDSQRQMGMQRERQISRQTRQDIAASAPGTAAKVKGWG